MDLFGEMIGQIRRAIDQSDCVLAIITGNIGPAVAAELEYALALGKLIVPVVREGIALPPSLRRVAVFEFSPWNAGDVEMRVVEFLKQQELGKETVQSMAAFVLAGLGVFLFGGSHREVMRIAIIDKLLSDLPYPLKSCLEAGILL